MCKFSLCTIHLLKFWFPPPPLTYTLHSSPLLLGRISSRIIIFIIFSNLLGAALGEGTRVQYLGTTQHFNRFYLSYFSCRANYSTIEWIVNTKSAGSHDINNIKQFTYTESTSFDNRIILKYLSVLLLWEQTDSQICANAALVVSSMDMVDLNVTCRARDKNDTITVSRNQTMLSIHNETTSGNSEVDLVLSNPVGKMLK